jgi:hypothetical protein
LHYCKESPIRNYLLTLLYLRSGKFKVLVSPVIKNLDLLPESSMKKKIESIYADLVISKFIANDGFNFSLIPKTKVFSINSTDTYLGYLTYQDSLYLCLCDFSDFFEKKIIYKQVAIMVVNKQISSRTLKRINRSLPTLLFLQIKILLLTPWIQQ